MLVFHVIPLLLLAPLLQVVVTSDTQAAMAAAQAAGSSTWRVSSTVFAHIASDVTLQPLGHFATSPEAAQAYPSIAAGLQVQRELEAIRLKRMETAAVKTSSPMVLRGSASQQQELGKTSSLEPLAGGEGVGLHNNGSSQALRRLVSSDGGNNIACVAIH